MRVQALVVEDKASQAARNPFAVPLRLIPDVNMGAIKVRLLLTRVLLVTAPLTHAWVLCRAVPCRRWRSKRAVEVVQALQVVGRSASKRVPRCVARAG